MKRKKQYPEWTRIKWGGNPALGFHCWRKSFRHGHVSVGCGDFLTVVYSYGLDSDDSMSGTRWNYSETPISEKEAMRKIDSAKGRYSPLTDKKS